MKKIVLGVFLAVLVNLASAGTPLSVAVYPGLDEAVRIAIPLYRKLHPEVEIQLVSLGYKAHHEAMIMALVEGKGLPDVMGVSSDRIGRLAESGWLENLLPPPYNAGQYSGLFHKAVYPVSKPNILAAMQVSVSAMTLVYREDLLRKAGLGEKDLTASWESCIKAGKQIKAATGACLVPDVAEIADLYSRAQASEQQGIYWKDLLHGCPLTDINSPRFKKAFELALSARQAGIDCKLSLDSNEWREKLQGDGVAALLISAQRFSRSESALSLNGHGRWQVAQLPGKSFVRAGGDFYAIPAKAQHKAEAWDFMKFLTLNAGIQTEWARRTGAFPALLEAQTPELMSQPIDALGGLAARKVWQTSLKNVKPHPFENYEATGDEIIRMELNKVLEGSKTIPDALKDAELQLRPRCRR